MSKIVIKYGGSNLKTPQGIQQLIRIISSFDDHVVVVVSAISGVTDHLENMVSDLSDKNRLSEKVKELRTLHTNFLNAHVGSGNEANRISILLLQRFEELEHLLFGAYYLKALPAGLYDQILSYGERLSSMLISELLILNGVACREVLPENIGLITSGEFKNASVDFDASENLVKQNLGEDQSFIIPGFYGISKENHVTLFGRGGTDYSAASIAACIQSKGLYIWKDVSGFMTADPRSVKGSENIPSLTYDEAAELAYFGAKILHPRTVEPLTKSNIPVYLYSSIGEPDIKKPLTVINGRQEISDRVVKSITFSDQFAILNLSGPGVGIKPGILAKVTSALNNNKINISSVITSHISINILLESKDIKQAESICRNLDLPFVSRISLQKDISLLALVGHGMTEKYGIASKVFTVLAQIGINVYLSSMGASPVTTYLIIDRENRSQAIEEIHNEFFNV